MWKKLMLTQGVDRLCSNGTEAASWCKVSVSEAEGEERPWERGWLSLDHFSTVWYFMHFS